MKSALKKDFFREIRRNSGRFISIFFIVLLGAAFYSGIRSANYDMKYSADRYYDESALMDFRVLGTLGLTEADLEDMRQVEGVERVTGGYTQEVLCDTGDTESVLKLIALTEDVNRVTLEEGRLPEAADECVVDVLASTELGFEIGDQITVRSGTEDSLEDALNYDTYTIVGRGTLPYYMELTRDSSAIGDGNMDAFVLVKPEAFSLDIYTEAYVQVQGAEAAFSYSDEYDDLTEPVKERLEEIADAACQRRYEEIRSDAEAELSHAREQVEEGETELSDAEREIADGWEELADGEETLKEKQQELADGEGELTDGEAELESAREEIAYGEAQLEEGEAVLVQSGAELENARAQYQDGLAQYEAGEAAWQEQKAQYDAGAAAYEENRAGYEAGLAAYQEKKAQYDAGAAAYQQGEEEYARQESVFQAGWDAFVSQAGMEPQAAVDLFEQTDALRRQLEEQFAAEGVDPSQWMQDPEYRQIVESCAVLQPAAEQAGELLEGQAALQESRGTLDAAKAQLEAAKPELEAAKAELDAAAPALEQVKAQLDAAAPQLEQGRAQLDASKAQLDAAAQQIADGEAELEAGRQEIEANRSQIQEAKAQLAEGEEELADARAQLEDGRKQLEEGWEELEDNRQKLQEAEQEYEEAREEAQPDLADAREQIADGEEELNDLEVPQWYVLGRSEIASAASFSQDAERMKNLGEVFPVLFFLVAALVSLTAMTRMVEEQRIQIGTLKALGYSDGVIAMKYFSYAMLATVTGAVLGIWIGEKALPYVIMDAYGMMYIGLPAYCTPINWDQGAMALAASAASTGIATLAACFHELRAKPAELMRPEAPKNGKRILLERIHFIWKHLSFNRKSTFRNLFRYKKRFIMTIIGIGGCMGLMLVGFGLQDSITAMAKRQYVEIFTYDAAVSLDSSATKEQKAALADYAESYPGMDETLKLSVENAELKNGDNSIDVQIYVPEDPEQAKDFVTLQDRVSQEKYDYPLQGAALSEKTAKMLKVSVGDTVEADLDGRTAKIPVVEIVENYVMHYMFLSPAQYEESFGEEPDYNQLQLNYEDTSAGVQRQMGSDMMNQRACAGITFVTDLEQQIQDMLQALNIVIYVLILSAGLLAFVVLYNLNNINITERRREMATLKVLGFYDSEVAMYVYRENIILTIIGIGAGALMGAFLHRFIIQTVEVDLMMFGRQISFFSYLLSGLITLIFSVLVNLVMYRNLKKIDMIESLKSVE